MLAAEALRLAAMEVLRPTASLAPGGVFPTLAGGRVFDSRMVGTEDLETDRPWTPCLSLFSEEVALPRRGSTAGPDAFPTAVLVINAELAVSATDPETGEPYADASASDDPTAKLVLGALCAQVRQLLQYAPAGSIFRCIGYVEDIRIEPFGVPQYGLRWLRNTMRITCRIKDDAFTDEAGLPEPLRSLATALPANSYAKGKLVELAAAFTATSRETLEAIHISTGGDPAVDGPEASA